jgi:four helix bundle protein
LLRSGTSIGANVHEAQGGQSRADFIAKISIAQKETLETGYWLRLIRESGMIKAERVAELVDEVEQLKKILAKILVTSKSRGRVVG